jgi:hypothetical protein
MKGDDAWAKSSEAIKVCVVMPDEVAADPEQARTWVERAASYVRTLPPKAPKAPKKG